MSAVVPPSSVLSFASLSSSAAQQLNHQPWHNWQRRSIMVDLLQLPTVVALLVTLVGYPGSVSSYTAPDGHRNRHSVGVTSRRDIFSRATSSLIVATNIIARQPKPAYAAGPDKAKATDKCRDGARNCIRTAWIPPQGKSKAEALADIRSVIKAYPQRGQSGVDCNGFELSDDKLDVDGTARIEFYSCIGPAAVSMNLAKPFVDDLKIALVDDDENNSVRFRLEVRSKSRVGASDYGVNKKRINYLADALRNKGWDAPKVVYGIGSYDAFF